MYHPKRVVCISSPVYIWRLISNMLHCNFKNISKNTIFLGISVVFFFGVIIDHWTARQQEEEAVFEQKDLHISKMRRFFSRFIFLQLALPPWGSHDFHPSKTQKRRQAAYPVTGKPEVFENENDGEIPTSKFSTPSIWRSYGERTAQKVPNPHVLMSLGGVMSLPREGFNKRVRFFI